MKFDIIGGALASALLISASLSSAGAADMPVKAPPMAAAPAWSWAGVYVGANAGYAWGSNNSLVTYTNNVGAVGTSPSSNAKGGFGGGQIGYNWQTGAVVFGLEADIQGASVSNAVSGVVTNFGGVTFAGNQKLSWFGTVRGRIGYAFDRALVYVTGGFADGHVRDTVLLSQGGGVTDLLTGSTQRNGTTIGGGLEYFLAKNWSAKAEYQYINLGHETLFGVSTAGVPVITNAIKDKFNTVRLGLNYHFN